ncbi:MAG: 50S ribosomal protein L22 [Chitinophagales bacterium]|nr:50S ribosomal protein L22 [Chitinophagales bacterium]
MAEARAILRNCQSSPRKMRYVADLVRGMDAEKALYALQLSSKHGAKPMGKLLRSAMDNWEKKNEGMRIEDARLFIKTVFVDGGRMLKRWLPAPHGRAYKKRKRSNHITLIVDTKLGVVETTAAAPVQGASENVAGSSAPLIKKSSSRRKKEESKAVTA